MADDLPVLFDDGRLVVVNKPPGIPVVPGHGIAARDCLRGRLEHQLAARVWVVHRLDRDASGVMAFARTPEAHRELCLAFERREVQKTYLAFTAGVPDPPAGCIDIPLHAARRGRTRPALPGEPESRDADTSYIVRRSWRQGEQSIALVEALPRTGRHHQIRVHLRAIGTPILFDDVYGRRTSIPGLQEAPCRRLALHAARLVMPERGGDRAHAWGTPLADDLAAFDRWLGEEWEGNPGGHTPPGF